MSEATEPRILKLNQKATGMKMATLDTSHSQVSKMTHSLQSNRAFSVRQLAADTMVVVP